MNYKKVSYIDNCKISSVINEYANETMVFIETYEGYKEYAVVRPCNHLKGVKISLKLKDKNILINR